MAVDLNEIMLGAQASNHQQGMALTNTVDRNLVQGFGVILETVVQSVASTADDAQLMAAMQTASRVPQQGQTPSAG